MLLVLYTMEGAVYVVDKHVWGCTVEAEELMGSGIKSKQLGGAGSGSSNKWYGEGEG
jgi:hypothetical protein